MPRSDHVRARFARLPVAPDSSEGSRNVLSGHPLQSVSDDLDDDLAMPRFVVELEEDDLLPCPEGSTTVDDREREARAEEGGADMAVAVSVMPPALVPVVD